MSEVRLPEMSPEMPPAGDDISEALKIPPHSIEAEQAVLGGVLIDNQAWLNVADRLVEHDFYRREHQLIFNAIRKILEEGNPCDALTLAEWLAKQGQLDQVDSKYIGFLSANTPSAANVTAYADIVRERSILRQLIRAGNEIAGSGFAKGANVESLLDQAEQLVFQIAEQGARGRGGFSSIRQVMNDTIDKIDKLFKTDASITGISTGFEDLDEKTSGLQRSDLVIVAGRPSMGKTSFAMNIAEHVAIKEQLPVAIFSMEMPSEQLAMRLLASLARINQQRVRTGQLEDDDWPGITAAVSLLSDTPLFIDDSPALNPTDLRARARRLAIEQGQLGLIVIDYLQLMQIPNSRENRATEVSEISRALKSLAKELDVPVIALSQLNRSLEQRPNKRPVMSDLRESGSIEQDADVIVFIYRDEVYNEDSDDKGTAEILIAKQRNGPIGTVRLTFKGHLTRFENYLAEDIYLGDDE